MGPMSPRSIAAFKEGRWTKGVPQTQCLDRDPEQEQGDSPNRTGPGAPAPGSPMRVLGDAIAQSALKRCA